MTEWGAVRLTELSQALFACRRAMQSTKQSLTETARREVSIYLRSELRDDEAADEWDEAVWNAAAEWWPQSSDWDNVISDD